jgi:hypothetical protein
MGEVETCEIRSCQQPLWHVPDLVVVERQRMHGRQVEERWRKFLEPVVSEHKVFQLCETANFPGYILDQISSEIDVPKRYTPPKLWRNLLQSIGFHP